MTGPQHYRLAEQLIEEGAYDEEEPDLYRRDIALAQVHATLALAAATALPPFLGLSANDGDDWARVLGRVVTL